MLNCIYLLLASCLIESNYLGVKVYDNVVETSVEKWRNVIDLVDFAAPVYILFNILNLIVLQKMHTGSDSAACLIYVAEVLCDLLVIPFSLQLQPTLLGQSIQWTFNGGTCPTASESKYDNVYTLGENNMPKAIFEAFKTVFVDFSSLCLVVLAIDRYIALTNPLEYGQKWGSKPFLYAKVLGPILVFFSSIAFLCFLLAAYYATSDKTQNKSGLAYCAYESFRFLYLVSTATLMFVFSALIVRQIIIRWRDPNADSYRHSAILTLLCILIKLPTIAYRISWVSTQMCIAYGMYLQYVQGISNVDLPWLGVCWIANDDLYYWQSVAYYKIVSLVILLNLCCCGAYRQAMGRMLICKSVTGAPVHTITVNNANNPVSNSNNRAIIIVTNPMNTNFPNDTSKHITVTGIAVQDLEKTGR